MSQKVVVVAKYIFFAVLTAALYGYAAFHFIFMNLAGGSMLHAYIWNIAIIIIFLSLDKIIYAKMQSRDFVITKRNYLLALWVHIENYISFKTTIYLFYIFVLIASRVSTINPALVSEDFRSFVLSIEYGLVLVIAFDKLTEHLFKDLKRVKIISDKFKKYRQEKKQEKKK